MFFGNGKGSESVELSSIAQLLIDSFNKKLLSLDSKASRTVNGIEDARRSLKDACDEFRALKKQPDTDFIRTTSVTYIMEQKDAYTTLLSRTMAATEGRLEERNTIYEKYYDEIQRTGSLLTEVMKANQKFKMVLDAFPNDLNRFKKAYAAIEVQWRMLKSELDSRNFDANEYHEILGYVNDLLELREELKVSEEAVREFEGNATRKVEDAEIAKIKAKVSSAREQIHMIERNLSRLKAESSVILSTIDKPVRKHDYLSLYKPKLTPLLDDHAGLRQREKYDEFYSQIVELKQEISEQKILVKNVDEVNAAIGQIVDGKLRKKLDEMIDLESNKSHLDSELREFERTEKELLDIVNGTSRRETSLGEIKARIEEIRVEQKQKKSLAEQLFLKYYKKQLTVIL